MTITSSARNRMPGRCAIAERDREIHIHEREARCTTDAAHTRCYAQGAAADMGWDAGAGAGLRVSHPCASTEDFATCQH
jgi:hypothetical protein